MTPFKRRLIAMAFLLVAFGIGLLQGFIPSGVTPWLIIAAASGALWLVL